MNLGPPFLDSHETFIDLPGGAGFTLRRGYEGKELLKSGHPFRWPMAPGLSGAVDLRRTLLEKGRGFVATVQLDARREWGYVTALNSKLRLLVGYVFPRADFPWVALWEENCARRNPPWYGRAKTRGLEFGSAPLPVGRRDSFSGGDFMGQPGFSTVPARQSKTVEYVAFLCHTRGGMLGVDDITVTKKGLTVKPKGSHPVIEIHAAGLYSGVSQV